MQKGVLVFLVLIVMAACQFAGVPLACAGELLDVKPVTTADGVLIEISADIPMTYTYYTVPGEARVVVDIADADPEKVEPLIVVKKGAVSSISVDKTQIAGMVVSRLIFNLVSATDINVKASNGRKTLTVSFGPAALAGGGATSAPQPVAAPAMTPSPEPAALAAGAAPLAAKEEDPLGLDEPPVAPAKAAPPMPVANEAVPGQALPVTPRPARIDPVVPAVPESKMPVVRAIVVGPSYIDIRSSIPVSSFRILKLSKPERLAIDLPGAASSMTTKVLAIRKLGVAKVRIGTNRDALRIVFDPAAARLRPYQVVSTSGGLRVIFK